MQKTLVNITKEDGTNVLLPSNNGEVQLVRNDAAFGSGIYYAYFSDGTREIIGGPGAVVVSGDPAAGRLLYNGGAAYLVVIPAAGVPVQFEPNNGSIQVTNYVGNMWENPPSENGVLRYIDPVDRYVDLYFNFLINTVVGAPDTVVRI